MSLPRMIHENAYEHIKAESIRLEEYATKLGGQHWQDFSRDIQNQNDFLDTFRKTFSVKMSIKMADIEYRIYQKWRRTSIHFVQTFNGIIEEWHDDIYVSAATRAKGYLIAADDTESGYQEDAEGNPIFHGADSKLTTMFIKAMYPEQFNDKMNLNMSGGLDHKSSDGSMSPKPTLTEAQQKQLDKLMDSEF